ncbi:MAG: MarR family transcriptional regulator, partial [Acidobacteria bacterium]
MAPSIQDEIKQRKPFSSLEEETALALARTSDLIQRRAAELFKSYGITGTQYNVLRILRGAGSEGIPCSEIGE